MSTWHANISIFDFELIFHGYIQYFSHFSRVLEENPGNLEMDVIIDAVVSYNKRYKRERLSFNLKMHVGRKQFHYLNRY